ncbi:MAG: hypothetical protein G01um101420_883 [Parcubacteria group bacterium Gr01-1014_20]|nr:MAG: hypothetical protein G01um101420_883 [Parcubacteria group bacterium Gr01-1014_20]
MKLDIPPISRIEFYQIDYVTREKTESTLIDDPEIIDQIQSMLAVEMEEAFWIRSDTEYELTLYLKEGGSITLYLGYGLIGEAKPDSPVGAPATIELWDLMEIQSKNLPRKKLPPPPEGLIMTLETLVKNLA